MLPLIVLPFFHCLKCKQLNDCGIGILSNVMAYYFSSSCYEAIYNSQWMYVWISDGDVKQAMSALYWLNGVLLHVHDYGM